MRRELHTHHSHEPVYMSAWYEDDVLPAHISGLAAMESLMSRRLVFGVLAVFGLMVAGASQAQSYSGEATLETPLTVPSETVIDSITWKCEEAKCVGRSRRAPQEPQVRECMKLVASVGPVTAFRSRGRKLSDEALAECNGYAKR